MAQGPAVAGSASAAQPVTSQMQDPMQGGGAPGGADPMQAFVASLQPVSQAIDAAAQQNPDLTQIFQQMKALLRQALVQKAQTLPQQTDSAMALPMAGQ